jgi:fibronectin-binding autotransporter adhesin
MPNSEPMLTRLAITRTDTVGYLYRGFSPVLPGFLRMLVPTETQSPMNHIHRIVFNRSQGIWQVVSENARGQGKGGRRLKPAASGRSPTVLLKTATLVMALAGICNVQLAWAQTVTGGGDVSPFVPPAPLPAWSVGGDLVVGNTGTGSLDILGGGKVDNTSAYLGFGASGNGTVTVSGPDSTWTNANVLYVGYSGAGTLHIKDEASVSSKNTWVGIDENSVGVINVSGAKSTFNTDIMMVGSSGSGTLNITGGATVNSKNSWVGSSTTSHGAVDISGDKSTWNADQLTIGSNGPGTLSITAGASVKNRIGLLGEAVNGDGKITVSGKDSVWENTAELLVGLQGAGNLAIQDGATVSTTFSHVGIGSLAHGTVNVSGRNSTWNLAAGLKVGMSGAGTLSIADAGKVVVGIAAGVTTLADVAGSTGSINIGGASALPGDATGAGTLDSASIRFGAGTGSLNFNHTDINYVFATPLRSVGAGTHRLNHYAGTTRLTGNSTAYSGVTSVAGGQLIVENKLGGSAAVSAGRFQVDGTFGGPVAVEKTGTLAGAGTVAGNTSFLGGGVLEGTQGQTLKIGGSLVLDGASQINAALGAAPSSALFDVTGNLTLAGTLNVSDQGGFGAGIYRLFDYRGVLTNKGVLIGSVPAGSTAGNLTVQASVGGRINLASAAGPELRFWDGGDAARHFNGVIDGGAGLWRADGSNWAGVDGAFNGPFQPQPTFAVFQGRAGTVTVDATAGAIGATGMQFATDGYRIDGDAIALQGAGGESIIRVGDGTASGAAMTGTIAATLAGASTLVKSDHGTLVLTGDNTYNGGTEIRAGVLSVSRDTNLGAAAAGLNLNGGTLATTASFTTGRTITLTQAGVVDVAGNTQLGLSGTIAGSAGLVKTGLGQLRITGDGSAFTGHTQVQAGMLTVGAGGAGRLGGTLTVADGATLQGTGTVGSTTLHSGSTIAPGNSIGTLTVAGDLGLLPGSVYRVEADPASAASDRIAVAGTATLAGSVVHISAESGFASTRQYTILSASTLQGQFGAVSSNFAYLDPKLSYGAHDVTLEFARKSGLATFADAAHTGNQRATAEGLDSLAAGNPLHEFILTLPAGAPPAVFDSLSGEVHASVSSVLTGSGATTRTLPLAHLRANLAAGLRPGAATAQAGGVPSAQALPGSNAQPAWAELVGSWQTLDGNGNAAKTTQRTGGLFVGADHAVGGGWRMGGALGYTDGNIKVDDRASKADVSSYSAALYGGKSFDVGAGKLNVLAGTSYTWHDIGSERYANVAGASQKLTTDYGANTTQLFTELGYAMALSDLASIEPFAGLAWSDMRTRGFSESGGSAALSGQHGSDKQTSSTLGVRGHIDFSLGRSAGKLRATLGWRHAFGEVTPQSTMAFDGGQTFTVAGAPIARNAVLAELGADLAISRNATVGLNYSGQYGGGNREHAGSVNVRWRY